MDTWNILHNNRKVIRKKHIGNSWKLMESKAQEKYRKIVMTSSIVINPTVTSQTV